MFIPISLKNDGTVVVIGGGRVALQKISTLLFAGVEPQNIVVIAKEFIENTKSLIQEKHIVFFEEVFSENIFEKIQNINFIISATNNKPAREEIYNFANNHKILINTVDAPQYSTFILPAIIKRGDLTISINSNGKVPLFVTFVRHTIEDILTKKLSGIYDYIATNYKQLKERYPNSQQRRLAFFHIFRNWGKHSFEVKPKLGGHVYFASAGIGDVENITIKTLNALRVADVILHDNLIPDGILDLARRDAIKINVAKYGSCKAGKCSTMQLQINDKIMEHASTGEIVVRLKGGDGGIFGQLASEIEAIENYNQHHKPYISYEVIPGLTTASVAVAELGLPLTAKGLASSVTILTYHSPSCYSDSFMQSVALRLPIETYAIYMCGKTIGNFAERIVEYNNNLANTPVAIMVGIGSEQETREFLTLESVIGREFASPVIAIVGNVVSLVKKND